MTYEYSVYNKVGEYIKHKTVNHVERHVDGDVHTKTLEGFRGLLKRA